MQVLAQLGYKGCPQSSDARVVSEHRESVARGHWRGPHVRSALLVCLLLQIACRSQHRFSTAARYRRVVLTAVLCSVSGASIAPHAAPCNLRLRVHLPLEGPDCEDELCGMRVSNQVVRWRPGEPILFDDSYEHETWNKTDQDRTVLLFDVWHPDLTTNEREAIINMFCEHEQQPDT